MHQALPKTKRNENEPRHRPHKKRLPLVVVDCLFAVYNAFDDCLLFRPFIRGCTMMIVRFGHAHVDVVEWRIMGMGLDWVIRNYTHNITTQ